VTSLQANFIEVAGYGSLPAPGNRVDFGTTGFSLSLDLSEKDGGPVNVVDFPYSEFR
jgi:hypothetical protein